MKEFIVIGASIAVMLIALSTKKSLRFRVVVIACASAVSALTFFVFDSHVYMGISERPWYDVSPFKEGVLFLFMILGMVARTLSQAIENTKKSRVSSETLAQRRRLNIDGWDFALPFLVSFITFGTVTSAVGQVAMSITSLIFAFQNGFFWQTIMKTRST